MEKTLALQNALGTFCYINTAHPDLLSSMTNYGCVYYVEVQADPAYFNIYELKKKLKPLVMDGTSFEVDYNSTIHRDILRIAWRQFETK